jgi:hypothetical protein
MKKCILGLKDVCDDCGACEEDRCDLDPNKLCDNCFKCLEITEAYREIPIGRVLMDGEGGALCVLDPKEEMEPEMDHTDDQGDSTGAPDDLDWEV